MQGAYLAKRKTQRDLGERIEEWCQPYGATKEGC